MSYSESYTVQVPFSGTVKYQYPQSEHGGTGTVSYSGEVPVSINIDIDSDPFDKSINGMNTALYKVASGVGAFQGAQLKAIWDREKRISETATNGFFRVIGNDISRELSENQNTLTADVALLVQKGNAIESIHAQMESDYRRIWTRYRDVFQRLDYECENSIIELDREVFTIANRHKTLLFGPFKEGAGKVLNSIVETGIPELLITGARVNKKMSGIINKMTDTAMIAEQYQADSKRICNSVPLAEKQYEYIPVIYANTDELTNNSQKLSCYTVDMPENNNIVSRVHSMVKEVPKESWKNIEIEEKEEIDKYFMLQFENYMEKTENSDKRVCEEILKMYRAGNIKTIEEKKNAETNNA